jgi:heptosyltransferase-2
LPLKTTALANPNSPRRWGIDRETVRRVGAESDDGLRLQSLNNRRIARKSLKGAKRILVKMPNWLGDVVTSLPTLECLRKCYPKAWIACLIKNGIADILRYNSVVDEVMAYDHGQGLLSLGRKMATIQGVRRKEFDIAVLLTNSFESALWMVLAGIPRRLGYSTDGRGLLLSHPVPRRPAPLHQIDYYLRLCQGVCEAEVSPVPRVRVPLRDQEWAEDFIRSIGVLPEDLLIGLCPGAAYGPAKRWLPGRFVDVCKWIAESYPAKFILFGGEGDREVCRMVADGIGRHGIDLCAKTTLREFAALLEKCALVLSNDSGAMHLAAAIGTRVIAIFGSTPPSKSAPPENCTVLWKNVPCSPCFKRECPMDFQCMTSISPQEVWRHASTILSEYEANRSAKERTLRLQERRHAGFDL